MSSAATIAPAASVMEAAPVAQAFARLAATLAALAAQPRSGPPAGYVPRRWHTLAGPLTNPLDHPATDPDRWAQFL